MPREGSRFAQISAGGGVLHQGGLAADGVLVAGRVGVGAVPFDVEGEAEVHLRDGDAVLRVSVDGVEGE